MVSSMRVTSSFPTRTKSGRAEVTKMFSGIVDNGLSLARIPAYRVVYRYQGDPECPLPELGGYYHAAKCTLL